ncbi:hypothetical protein [Selenomonas sp. FC4001]|uniref:RNA dependent RNA polymerase n=1 Tax=Selenomonas sp. FC4001 TaxID=1408313 RepID=UPI00055C3223|nr:hypothetical protein [Selenomonas sp. FC4001]
MSDNITRQYQLFTLDAEKIINNSYRVIKDKYNNYTVEYKCNFVEGELKREIIKNTDTFTGNALLYQIVKVLGKREDDELCLNHCLIFVDFSEIFSKRNSIDNIDDKTCPTKYDIEKEAGLSFRLSRLFEDGIYLSFDGNDWKRFVPFDKSNSMARQSRISFIDYTIKEELENRLLLDIDFSSIELCPSKYYAYRGLYMSSGSRIEQNDKFCLNEETVIVLPDEKISSKMNPNITTVFTEKEVINSGTEDEEIVFGNKEEKIEFNYFDGEGLICPEYARYISEILQSNYDYKRPSHSFQVRMPFTKGMLHEVDYNKFFSDTIGVNDSLWVVDYLGKKRNVRKAKILLTASMFKCHKWIKEWAGKNNIDDPVAYFFNKFSQYEHALYVTGTDARLSNNGKVKMNYQFLSTLDIPSDSFASIVNDKKTKIESFRNAYSGDAATFNFDKLINEEYNLTSYCGDNSFEDDIMDIEDDVDERKKCLHALRLNPAFVNDYKVKEILAEIIRTSERDICIGHFEISGEQRYLSRDLLRFMIAVLYRSYIGEESIREIIKSKWENINKYLLYRSSRHFYMPVDKLSLKADKYYAFFRSPHLSRHEQCVLRPFLGCEMYDRYFSHLKGVVMVSYDSFVPMMLGGADFDGDLVKIISDRRIVSAVQSGVYNYENKEYVRKNEFPVIKIPDRIGKTTFAPKRVPYEVIKNTFSNQIGQISNLAIKIAKNEYGKEPSEQYKNKCAECTIVTGLEIDAAKTGVHPKNNINKLKSLGLKTHVFLDTKVKMSKLAKERLFTPYIKQMPNGTLSLYRENPNNSRTINPILENISVYSVDDEVSNLERLPGIYLEYIYNYKCKKESGYKTRKRKSEADCFKFQYDETWKEKLDTKKKDSIRSLMYAYQEIRSRDYNLKKFRHMNKDSNYWGYIYRILQIQYDSFHQLLPCKLEVEEACSITYKSLYQGIESASVLKEIFGRMKDKRWHFTARENRASVLAEILGDNINCTEPIIELLSNFRNSGYMLLFYMLKEIQSKMNENIDIDDYTKLYGKTSKIDCRFQNQYKHFLKQLESIYSYHLKQNSERPLWHTPVIRQCREIIAKILGEWNSSEALKYVFSCPKADRRNFLWNIFTEKELSKEIIFASNEEKIFEEE